MSLVPCATPTAEDRYNRLAIHLRNVQRYLPENEQLAIAAVFTDAVSYDQIQERLRIKLAVILTPELLHENTAVLYMTQVLLRHFPDLMDKHNRRFSRPPFLIIKKHFSKDIRFQRMCLKIRLSGFLTWSKQAKPNISMETLSRNFTCWPTCISFPK